MSKSSRAVKLNKCSAWIYGPQVSELNAKFGVGGTMWKDVYESCTKKLASAAMYGDFTPEYVVECAITERRSVIMKKITSKLKECETILDVLLIHSAIINGLGLVLSDQKKIEDSEVSFPATITGIHIFYEHLYESTKKILADKETINIFIKPTDFIKLNDVRSARPTNIVLDYGEAKVIAKYKIINENSEEFDTQIYVHPIKKEMRKCDVSSMSDCTLMFSNIKNMLFKPLAEVITCHCSFFKQKLVKIKNPNNTYRDIKMANKISDGDYKDFSDFHTSFYTPLKPLLIRQYKEDENTCEKKTYLSQLFSNCCSVLYKPVYITPKTNTIDDMMAATKQNILIANSGCRPYAMGQLTVFGTSILNTVNINGACNIPVFFIIDADGQPEKVYDDKYSGPSRQFFSDVIKELLDKDVFIPSNTFFKNQRYELNTKFDVNKLQCYSELPDAVKTADFKEKITKYFFIFVGNLIHFSVINNIELPFKLSRVYILQLFNIINFLAVDPETNALKISSPENLETQLLLISLYLLEKSPESYTKNIFEIFQDPQKLLTDADLIGALDADLSDEDADTRSKGVRMNGRYIINATNTPIYSENKETLFLNVVELLYKTALKDYFEDINSETVVNGDFKKNKYLQNFFGGYNMYKNFNENPTYQLRLPTFNTLSFKHKLGIVRKVDIFLSGFGVTHNIIRDILVPLIRILSFKYGDTEGGDMSPLLLFNSKGTFVNTYITDTSIGATNENSVFNKAIESIERQETNRIINSGTVTKLKIIFMIYRVLLNRGEDISRTFVESYNKKFYNVNTSDNYGNMTDEDYHNEFVKLFLKAWSGSPSISKKGYTVHFQLSKKNLPTAYSCFNNLYINKQYDTTAQLYKDLVIFATEGTNFGEAFTGGKNKKISKKM